MTRHRNWKPIGTAILAAACTFGLALPTASLAASRFHGDVAGVATGPGHSFVVGDGLLLRFKDAFRSNTRYRVCYSRGAGRRCHSRTTGAKNTYSRIFIAAPGGIGTYTAKWTVKGQVVARWSWYNGVGD